MRIEVEHEGYRIFWDVPAQRWGVRDPISGVVYAPRHWSVRHAAFWIDAHLEPETKQAPVQPSREQPTLFAQVYHGHAIKLGSSGSWEIHVKGDGAILSGFATAQAAMLHIDKTRVAAWRLDMALNARKRSRH